MLSMLCLSFIHYFCIKDSKNSKKKYTAIFNGIFIVVREPSDQMGKGGGGGGGGGGGRTASTHRNKEGRL